MKLFLRKRKTQVIKAFGKPEDGPAVRFSICGYTKSISDALAHEFSDIDQVEVIFGDILTLESDCLVSPANSFGEMSGGLDKAIDDFFGGVAQSKAIEAIRFEYMGGASRWQCDYIVDGNQEISISSYRTNNAHPR